MSGPLVNLNRHLNSSRQGQKVKGILRGEIALQNCVFRLPVGRWRLSDTPGGGQKEFGRNRGQNMNQRNGKEKRNRNYLQFELQKQQRKGHKLLDSLCRWVMNAKPWAWRRSRRRYERGWSIGKKTRQRVKRVILFYYCTKYNTVDRNAAANELAGETMWTNFIVLYKAEWVKKWKALTPTSVA